LIDKGEFGTDFKRETLLNKRSGNEASWKITQG